MSSFEMDGLVFAIGRPRITGPFEEVQDARRAHYSRTLPDRNSTQIATFIAKTSPKSWKHPQASVREGQARAGQWRWDPKVVAAHDARTGRLEGFAYAAHNVSSNRPHVLGVAEKITKAIGHAKNYTWIREIINPSERSGLETVMTGLLLKQCFAGLPVTCYPFKEEAKLKRQLHDWGLRPETEPTSGMVLSTPDYSFGIGHPGTIAELERWSTTSAESVGRSIAQIPGAQGVIERVEEDCIYTKE